MLSRYLLAWLSIAGIVCDLLGGLYLAYDLLGGRRGPLRTLARAAPYAIVFGALYTAGLPLSFGPPAGVGRGLRYGLHRGESVGLAFAIPRGASWAPPAGFSHGGACVRVPTSWNRNGRAFETAAVSSKRLVSESGSMKKTPPIGGQDSDVSRSWALRAATPADVDAIAQVWHVGWADGHHGHVPRALHEQRGIRDLRERVAPRLLTTTVATVDSGVVGFVVVVDDEIEQLYVAQGARGSDVAAVLLESGEGIIASRHDLAWLAVVAGNARARRFYERNGWRDAGPIDYPAETSSGPLVVPARRYEKRVRP